MSNPLKRLLDRIGEWINRFSAEQSAKKFEVDPKSMNMIALEYAALLGVSIVGVMQLLQVSRLDWPLYVSLIAFAVAIPLLAYGARQARHLQQSRYDIPSPWVDRVGWFAMCSSVLGIIGIFWHFWWIAGVLFILCALVAWGFGLVFSLAIEDANEEANRGDTVEANDRDAQTRR